MPTPQVSHRNWERVEAVAKVLLGAGRLDATALSFTQQLKYVVGHALPDSDGEAVAFRDSLPEFVNTHYLAHLGTSGAVARYDPSGRDRAHRPEVPEDLFDATFRAAELEEPQLFVEDLSYDDALTVVLDGLVDFLEWHRGYVLAPGEEKPDLDLTAGDSEKVRLGDLPQFA